ncbi:ferredoxin [uncultured Roseobacter sp.]|uniref:ferredoxin n=1 Tax=uncultured Roseobacter sp. TaxID=114847 RepID=UPI00262B6527|nr:ferredoxin [uncultured Roseobacter sp.]
MTLPEIERLAAPSGLFVMGAFHPPPNARSDGHRTLLLLGAGRLCWPTFKSASEYRDGHPDPLDRWSKRVIGAIAAQVGAHDIYPSDGPPYAPFIDWALDTGRFFQSPTGMMVHDSAGLMISIRGALAFTNKLDLDSSAARNPCDTCIEQPCVSACPVGALSGSNAYDVPGCKAYLDTMEGQDCMENGCQVRRVCPVSMAFDRAPEQSAFHMTAFKG